MWHGCGRMRHFSRWSEAISAKLTAEQIVFGAGPFSTEDLADRDYAEAVDTREVEPRSAVDLEASWSACDCNLARSLPTGMGGMRRLGRRQTTSSSGSRTFRCMSGMRRRRSGRRRIIRLRLRMRRIFEAGRLTSDKGAVRALAYDVVLNGSGVGIGIDPHSSEGCAGGDLPLAWECPIRKRRERFGFFLDALEYGTPPHGGIALGLDRIVMILAGASSLREVIAFPKTARAIDLMVDAPSAVSEQQMRELSLRTVVRS